MGIEVSKLNTFEEEKQENTVDSKKEEKSFNIDNNYNNDVFVQRGFFKANGYEFTVYPIMLDEVSEYIHDGVIVPKKINNEGKELTDKELGQFLITCFSSPSKKEDSLCDKKETSIFKSAKSLFKREKNIIDYSQYQYASGFVKWIEKKVFYKGKPIMFQDLERKYFLTKPEIAKLIIYLNESSGF